MIREELFEIFLDEGRRHLSAALALVSPAGPLDAGGLAELFRRLHSLKGMAASLGLDELMHEAHLAEEDVARVREEGAEADADFCRRLAPRVESLLARVDGLDPAAPPASGLPRREREEGAPEPSLGAGSELPQVRLGQDRLDRLLDLCLRLSAAQQRLEHELGLPENPRLLAVRDILGDSVRSLRREVLELRLLPVRGLVPLLEQALRRWARDRGVLVGLSVRGDAIRVDRAVLERLLDPLGHLLRNSVVHGLEAPAERLAAKKGERGRIELRVTRERDELCFELADDGRGVDPRLLGVESLPATGALGCDSLMLLTRPGVSRLGSADQLAGRGVGLDVVRSAVEGLGGRLELESRRGQGFSARMLIPAQVALLDAFVVWAGGRRLAVPVSAVEEIREGVAGEESESLAGLLGLGSAPAARPLVLLVRRAGRVHAIEVEAVTSRQQLVVRPLGAPLDRCGPWAGAALLPSGGLALVLDLQRLLTPAPAARLAPAGAAGPA